MSESIVRKVQPFTIGTRLSVPTVPKCQEFTQTYLPSEALDNCVLQHNLNSLYLSRSQVCAHGPCLVPPIVKQVAPVKRDQEHMAAEDQLNQNVASASAVSRSIKKITISGSKDKSEDKTTVGPAQLSITGSTSENNNNNNNITSSSSTSDPLLPRIVGVSCENKPNSQFKVLLRKDSSDEFHARLEQTKMKMNGEESVQQVSVPGLKKKEPQRKESHPHTQNEVLAAVTSQSDCFTQRNSLFNKEVVQAEAWIKGKLQDLKDGCNIQCCPLQDWEEASQTLQRDLKDFENTLIQLNQMGEQLICKLNPTSDLVKKQLSQLRDQWLTLKQMAANQTRALGGAKNLQEFNKKVDKLEAWIKEKQEEEQSLVNVLGENVDKMQLTRKILDLKQDEQLHRNLHEEINNLALKLEKQGKTDGKNISSRRKQINKMWLKVQSHLKNYHENLHLALEVSSFYQQADNTLFAINNMRKSMAASKELENFGDREIRDIASQIMMLDVSVSQLSNLHPALAASVTQKQSEVKDCWTLLQKVFRSDRTTLSLTGSAFTREDADLLTPAREPQCIMGMETHGIMGKEVKEEQNRLKGYVSAADCGSGRRTQSSQSPEQQSVTRTSPAMGAGPACADDAIVRHQLKGESRKPRAEPKLAAAPQGHPQLHMQLQKFTVSADKTLSWLKDNVSMATQVCSIASFEGLEAARRCQHTLEQEILTNRARIEVVKREGHGLVRAQHPGSTRIEEFLGQLEVLWEELRRRHQRNAVFLQASEELGFRAVKVLQALGSLEAWLESVELSMKESALAGDPETMSVAERESCLLEREVAARSLELSALRQEVERLHGHSHPHTRGLPARMEEVERKYHRVQSALTQQSSELQDTRMLTEFLERVELEESQELSGSRYGLGQPLHSEISSASTLLGLQSSSGGGGGGEPLIETMGDPVEELREAVEMLNDTVRERGRSQSHDQAVQELLSKHASLAVRVEERLCCSKDLGLDILEKETDMAIQCEPDHCGLEALQEKQDHLEIDYEIIREEVKEMEDQASRMKELCPERVHVLEAKIQATLQAWNELGKSVTENKSRLREFVQLQDFFRSYLAMISWTEDTRSCIFSDTALHLGRDGQKPLAAELDMQIERKFNEFDELAATGKNLLDKEHHLTQMVRERMEELRNMLGWILVHWRAQKQQWLHKKSRQECSQDNIYSEATMCPPETSTPEPEVFQSQQCQVVSPCEDTKKAARDSQHSSHEEKQSEDGYEVMNSIGPQGDFPKTNIMVLKEGSSPPTGGTVNLILSFGNTGDSQVQVFDLPARTDEVVEETSEPVHRPTVPQSSACKNFWRRCQGLLENTLGSLKRKRKIYRQSANEDHSMSLLSVHMDLDGACQQRAASQSLEDMERPEKLVATGGRCFTLSGKPELQSMEGTLERKHKLQLGGKKAASRGWNSYHAVLYRHTLCFYQDRKDTLRSSACGLPLNLTGAECSPAPDYTKKPNCFRLRLRDGSEYLLNASSRFMMKKWMMKIQANTDQSVSSVPGVPVDRDLSIFLKPSLCFGCPDPASCRCSPRHDVTRTFPRNKPPPGSAQTKEIVVLTRDFGHLPQTHLKRLDEQSAISSSGCCGDDDDDDEGRLQQTVTHRLSGGFRDNSPVSSGQDWLSSKRRSHSFTSATYQKIKPMLHAPGGKGPDQGSNYCVTLVVGDKSADGLSVSRSSEPPLLASAGWQQDTYQDSALKSYASLPRPRNKSVFKKFFGKKDF
ncbi:spectrin beta chain, non-erythrocytic 2 isoform X6 [Stegastes partitus]|uniref:Spectrin beta chain, non-erythrocytic 2 isoform X6 n=1 Tax=Stegastes partitus TaxID=144197 RepID=A0A9Y4NLF7_9TELE|nr:PREDICTED: spectrin beta chain, non-erythrocytic 2-like isoform X6 [Stegastes partitus]